MLLSTITSVSMTIEFTNRRNCKLGLSSKAAGKAMAGQQRIHFCNYCLKKRGISALGIKEFIDVYCVILLFNQRCSAMIILSHISSFPDVFLITFRFHLHCYFVNAHLEVCFHLRAAVHFWKHMHFCIGRPIINKNTSCVLIHWQ